MDDAVREALSKDRLIDITTNGRRTRQPRRIEIAFAFDGAALHITGRPGRRGWYANLRANPRFVVHLKQSLQRDLPASAEPVVDVAERQAFFAALAQRWPVIQPDFEGWLARAPFVRVALDEQGAP